MWKQQSITLEDLHFLCKNTMAEALGIQFTEIGKNFLKASMPITWKVLQPQKLLHGGASAVLVETIGSVASWLSIDPLLKGCVGIEINCNHIRGVKDGIVIGMAEPLHIGSTTHVWDVKIRDEKEKLVCASRLTVAIIDKR
jgi:1,4-dihydroxy-2-naphthoyl-CoA hydrolase